MSIFQNTLLVFAVTLLASCGEIRRSASLTRSLTGDDFTGKKYYLGWGAAMSSDPSHMHNEVKYDVLHTHGIFTNQVGGNYLGTTDIGSQVNRSIVTKQWQALAQKMTPDDMFVQYSSGHGSRSGLAVGVSYNEIRDNALSYPAKEIVMFTMACYSGNLVNAFNNARTRWENFPQQGRSLLVMASSSASESSSTGPGRDPDQPDSPYGSAGSAFGHALWKSLIGYADGYIDGVKDGYITFEEIVEFTKKKTKDIGGHTPQITGAYNGNVIMNRVPPRAFFESLDGSTEGLSDEEVMAQIESLNEAMRLP